jgi:hypothetical protein
VFVFDEAEQARAREHIGFHVVDVALLMRLVRDTYPGGWKGFVADASKRQPFPAQ